MNNRKLRYAIFALVVVVLIQLACGSSNTGQKVGEVTSPTSAPVTAQVYKVGDIVQIKDQTIVLNSAEIQNDILKAISP